MSGANLDEPPASMAAFVTKTVSVEGLTAEVPSLLVDCFQYILENGLVEGIFRVSGSIKRMRDVTTNYATYKAWLDETSPSPHDVSGIAKKFTRDYLHSIGGLFPHAVLVQLRALFVDPPRKDSLLGSESYRSTSTSFSSGLESVLEEAEDPAYSAPRTIAEKLDSLAALLVTKNSARKNAIFIYYLSVLKCVSAHQDETRMPNANLAIVFQQYLFETWVVADLQLYQNLLEFLLDNYESFVAKYCSNLGLLGGIEEFDTAPDTSSMMFSESVSTSPLTDYSSHQASPPKFSISGSFDGRRRSSISQKFSSFWEAYASPANRSKRFSFMSKGSGRSSDRLPMETDETETQGSTKNENSAAIAVSSSENLSDTCPESEANHVTSMTLSTSRKSSVCSLDVEGPPIMQGSAKDKGFMGFLEEANGLRPTAEPAISAPPQQDVKPGKNVSVDSLILENNTKTQSPPNKRQSVSRRLSLWLRRK